MLNLILYFMAMQELSTAIVICGLIFLLHWIKSDSTASRHRTKAVKRYSSTQEEHENFSVSILIRKERSKGYRGVHK